MGRRSSHALRTTSTWMRSEGAPILRRGASRESLGSPDCHAVSACRATVTCTHEDGRRCVTRLFR